MMMWLKDWQHLINIVKIIVRSCKTKTNVNNYKVLVKFLESKGVRVAELDTQL